MKPEAQMGGRVGTEVDASQVGFCPRAKSLWGLVLGEALLTQPTGREAGGQKLCGPRPMQACTSTGRGLPSSFFTAAPPPSHWSTCWDAPDSLSAHQAPKLGGPAAPSPEPNDWGWGRRAQRSFSS